MMIKYYVKADTYTTGAVNGKQEKVFAGRVKAIVEAGEGCYAEAIAKGKAVIEAGLPEQYKGCNYGCMPVAAVEEMGDTETYDRMMTIE